MDTDVIGQCFLCAQPTTCGESAFGLAYWEVYCRRCDIVTGFPVRRYPTRAHVAAAWTTRRPEATSLFR